MIKVAKFVALTLFVATVFAAPAMAQPAEADAGSSAVAGPAPFTAVDGSAISFSGAIGAGLTAVGGAYGIGKLAAAAVESQARQPEVAGTIQVTMIIAAALIEGFTFFALIVCYLQNPWG